MDRAGRLHRDGALRGNTRLVFKAHRWLHHSTLGSRVIKKKKPDSPGLVPAFGVMRHTSCWGGGRAPDRLPLVLRVRELLERRRILVASHREGVTRPVTGKWPGAAAHRQLGRKVPHSSYRGGGAESTRGEWLRVARRAIS